MCVRAAFVTLLAAPSTTLAASHTIVAACLRDVHYPVSTYADAVRAVLKPNTGRLIVTPKAKMRQAKSVSKSVLPRK